MEKQAVVKAEQPVKETVRDNMSKILEAEKKASKERKS